MSLEGKPAGNVSKSADTAKKLKKAPKETADKAVGKFSHGDHMVHLLLQKGKKFIAANPEDR